MRNKKIWQAAVTKKSSKEVVNNKATFDFYTSFSFFPFYFQMIPWQSGSIVMSFIDKKLSYITEKTWKMICYIFEAVVQRCSVKEVFLEISQSLQENTCSESLF